MAEAAAAEVGAVVEVFEELACDVVVVLGASVVVTTRDQTMALAEDDLEVEVELLELEGAWVVVKAAEEVEVDEGGTEELEDVVVAPAATFPVDDAA